MQDAETASLGLLERQIRLEVSPSFLDAPVSLRDSRSQVSRSDHIRTEDIEKTEERDSPLGSHVPERGRGRDKGAHGIHQGDASFVGERVKDVDLGEHESAAVCGRHGSLLE
jgi:hypothetical protein